MNRDYDKRPTQGMGRSAHDYGNTRLGEGRKSEPLKGIAIGLPIGTLLWAVIIVGWWLW